MRKEINLEWHSCEKEEEKIIEDVIKKNIAAIFFRGQVKIGVWFFSFIFVVLLNAVAIGCIVTNENLLKNKSYWIASEIVMLILSIAMIAFIYLSYRMLKAAKRLSDDKKDYLKESCYISSICFDEINVNDTIVINLPNNNIYEIKRTDEDILPSIGQIANYKDDIFWIEINNLIE